MFSLLPNALFTGHLNANANTRGLSPQLWQRAAKNMLPPNGDPGFFFADDFLTFGGVTVTSGAAVTLPSATNAGPNGYRCYIDIAGSLDSVTGFTGGVTRLLTGATDENLSILGTGDILEISRTADERAVTIFEARFALPTQVTSGSTFVGLASQDAIADGGLVTGASGELLATAHGIGFRTLDADPDGIDFVYQEGGSTVQVVKDAAKVVTAGEMVKFGFIYDPAQPNDKKIAFYIDGVKQTTYITDTMMAASTFPNSVGLGLYAAACAEGAVTRSLDLDWWAVYQGAVDG